MRLLQKIEVVNRLKYNNKKKALKSQNRYSRYAGLSHKNQVNWDRNISRTSMYTGNLKRYSQKAQMYRAGRRHSSTWKQTQTHARVMFIWVIVSSDFKVNDWTDSTTHQQTLITSNLHITHINRKTVPYTDWLQQKIPQTAHWNNANSHRGRTGGNIA